MGLPPVIGRAKRKAFSEITERVGKEFQTWKEKSLSQGGKEIILKVVALSILTFAMSYFKLPDNFCAELKSLMAQLWWDQRGNERKIHWIGCGRLCESKFYGELDFRDLKVFKQALST